MKKNIIQIIIFFLMNSPVFAATRYLKNKIIMQKKVLLYMFMLFAFFICLDGVVMAAVSPVSLSISVDQGSNAASQSFHVSNEGGGTLIYSVSDDVSWISCTPQNETSTGELDLITINYNTSGLPAGTYLANVTVSAPGVANSPQIVPVSLTVNTSAAPTSVPSISLSTASLSASATQGTDALSQSFKINNSGGGTLSYTISDNASWLSCSPTRGTSTGEQDTIIVNYSTSGLSEGTYTAIITIAASGVANSPQAITVSLRVNAPVIAPSISFSPASISASVIQGSNATSQSFQISNSGGGTLSYAIYDNASWLSCNPTSGTSSGEQDTITVNYSTSGLSAGTYYAKITITDSNATNSPRSFPVTLTIIKSGSAGMTSWGDSNLSISLSQYGSDNGIWTYNGRSWIKLTESVPREIVPWGTNNFAAVFTDYGKGNGIWSYNGTSWIKPTDSVPREIISWGANNFAAVFTDYGKGNGIWSYNGTSWTKFTDSVPREIISWGTNNFAAVFTDYGIGNGIWSYNGKYWTKITNAVPREIVSWGTDKLAVVFTDYDSYNGIWSYNGNTWTKLTSWVPSSSTKLTAWGGNNLAASFSDYDTGNGVWSYNGTSWTKLSNWISADLNSLGSSKDGNLICMFTDYGSDNGIYQYGSSWLRITDWVPADEASWSSNSMALLSTGSDVEEGIWSYNGTSLLKLSSWICDHE